MKAPPLVRWFFYFLAAAGGALASYVWFGSSPIDGSGTCKAICGLTLLVISAVGEGVGRAVGGILWALAGVFFLFVGLSLREKR
jgi:hypothetical protein